MARQGVASGRPMRWRDPSRKLDRRGGGDRARELPREIGEKETAGGFFFSRDFKDFTQHRKREICEWNPVECGDWAHNLIISGQSVCRGMIERRTRLYSVPVNGREVE